MGMVEQTELSFRKRLFSRRRRMIIGFWIAQSVLAYAAVPTLVCTSLSELEDLGSTLLYPSFIAYGVTAIAIISMLQFVFVLPVRPPGSRRSNRALVPVWTRLLLAASIATPFGIIGVGLHLLFDTYDSGWVPLGLDMVSPPVAFWIGWVVGLVVAIPIVAVLVRKELPPIISACVAGCMTGLLVFAAIMAGASLLDHTVGLSAPAWAQALMLLGPFLVGWGVSTPLLYAFIRRRDTETALKRLASLLFIGTAVETLAIIPLDVFVRRRSTCYCGEGTYLALVTLVPLGFAALGPMIFLVAASKRRKRYINGQCELCGYDMTGNVRAERCPECGAGWKPPAQDALRADSV